MARRISRSRVVRAPERKFVWARFTALQNIASGQTVRFDLMDDFNTRYGADLLGATVVRIRGAVQVQSTNVGQQAVMSAIVEPDEVATPDQDEEGPIHNAFADWMMIEPLITNGANPNGNLPSARMIDVKSQRKMEELGETLYLYVSAAAGNSVALTWWTYLSIGLKLP